MKHKSLVVAVVALLAMVALAVASAHRVTAQQQSAPVQKRAALVVQFGDGSYLARCISFNEEGISGLELLIRSGLEVVTWGGAVCRIDKEGCNYPAKPCFCQCQGPSCQYWSYWHWRDDRWVYSQVGSADYRVRDGEVEAWMWGNAQNPPAMLSFETVCGSPPPTTTEGAQQTAPGPTDTQQTAAQGIVASSRQVAPLGQYALFLAMALVLVAGFWILRGRYRG